MEEYYSSLKDVQYSFYCTRELANKFDKYCVEHGTNKSAFFRNAIKAAVEE